MRQVFSRVKRPLSDERGNILVLTSFLILGLFLMALGLIEVGRFLIVREQVQTVGDAAALAGVGAKDSAQRWVKIVVHEQYGSRSGTDSKGRPICIGCGSDAYRNIIGLESDLIDNGGWRRYSFLNCGSCDTPYDHWYEFEDRFIIYNLSDVISQITELRTSAKDARNSITNAVDNILRNMKTREHRAFTTMYSQVLGGISLEDKQELADNESKFTRKYVTEVRGFSKAGNLCSTEYTRWKNSYYWDWDVDGYRWDYNLKERYYECVATVNFANEGHRALQSIRHVIDDSQSSISDMEVQVEEYITDAQNTANNPNYISGKDKSVLATRAFLEKAIKAKKLEFGEGKNNGIARVTIQDVKVFSEKGNPYFPSVAILLKTEMPVIFQDLFPNLPILSSFYGNDTKGIGQTTCSQAATFYYDPRGHRQYSSDQGKLYDSINKSDVIHSDYTKYYKVPKDYCQYWREEKHRLP